MKLVGVVLFTFIFVAVLTIVWLTIESPENPCVPVFREEANIGPPPSRIEIYLDGQGYWHVIIDGEAVCSCTGGY